jgi:hypothetical protein
MFPALRFRLLTFAAALALFVGSAGGAEAGWVTIKNDTNAPIVLQQTICVNGQPKCGKPIRLLPGETVREWQPGSTVTKVEVFDGQNPKKSLYTGNLNIKDENQSFSVTTDGRVVSVIPAGRGN